MESSREKSTAQHQLKEKFLAIILPRRRFVLAYLTCMRLNQLISLFYLRHLVYSTFTYFPTITRVGCSTLYCWCLFAEGYPCFARIYERPGPSVGLFSADLTSMFCCPLSSHGFPSTSFRPPLWKSCLSLIIKLELSLNVTVLRTRYFMNTGRKAKMWNEV